MEYTETQVQVKKFEDLNIFQVRLPLPFRLDHVNCYLFQGKDGWVLVDTGLNYPEGRRAWKAAMREIGMKPEEIKAIYLTHYHPDHYGMAGYLQQLSDAPVYISEMDASGVDIFWVNYREIVPVMGEMFMENGMPAELVLKLVENMKEGPSTVRPLAKLSLIQSGRKVKLGDHIYEAIWTPGHSDGHLCFFCRETGVLLSGDHLLPRITSNISLWPYSMPNPLEIFLDSLNKIKDLPVGLVLPAHDSPFTNHTERVDQLIEHHRDRLAQMYDYVDDTTAYDVCSRSFSPNLNLHELRFAILETMAHLAYMEDEKKVERYKDGGVFYYRKIQPGTD